MENSLGVTFDKIPCTIAHGLWPDFGATLKIHKKSNYDRNQLKLDKQHKNMYMHQKKIIKMENSLGVTFDKIPCTIAHGLWPDFGATLKLSQHICYYTEHVYMHMHYLQTCRKVF